MMSVSWLPFWKRSWCGVRSPPSGAASICAPMRVIPAVRRYAPSKITAISRTSKDVDRKSRRSGDVQPSQLGAGWSKWRTAGSTVSARCSYGMRNWSAAFSPSIISRRQSLCSETFPQRKTLFTDKFLAVSLFYGEFGGIADRLAAPCACRVGPTGSSGLVTLSAANRYRRCPAAIGLR